MNVTKMNQNGSNQHKKKVGVSAETPTAKATLQEVAKALKVGRSSMEKVRYIKEKGIPEALKAVEEERISVEPARLIVKLPKEKQNIPNAMKRNKEQKPLITPPLISQPKPEGEDFFFAQITFFTPHDPCWNYCISGFGSWSKVSSTVNAVIQANSPLIQKIQISQGDHARSQLALSLQEEQRYQQQLASHPLN